MEFTRSRYKSIDGRAIVLGLIGLVFLSSEYTARGQSNPDPVIVSISPKSTVAVGPTVGLTVFGRNFVGGSVVQWNKANRTTKMVNSGQLEAEIKDTDIAFAGSADIAVFNPPPGGGFSSVLVFTIVQGPTITSIKPASALAGETSFLLTVNGTNFVAPDASSGAGGSKIQWEGAQRNTNFVSRAQLTTLIPAADIATARPVAVTVFTPGLGTTTAATFTINNRQPQITGINPVSATAGGPAFTLTVNGTGFFNGSVVRWNGAPRTTTFIAGEFPFLRAAIPDTDIATAGLATITVFNPAPGGGPSNGVSFTVANPVPRVTSLEPASATAG